MLLNNQYEYNAKTDLIGSGGFAKVYKAFDKNLQMTVALKRYNVNPVFMDKYSLLDEIRKAIHYTHPNIVRYFNCFSLQHTNHLGEEEEVQFGVMEYVEGGDLKSFFATQPNFASVQMVINGILQGLNYLHTADVSGIKPVVIHRDLKPANILIKYVNGVPVPKICDFGISKEMATANNAQRPITYTMVGTAAYMAPEQISNRFAMNGKLNPNVDLWALGIILYEYFVGKSLFGKRANDANDHEVIANILEQPLPTLQSPEIKNIPAPYNQIITKCLVRNAAERVQTAQELLQLLGNKNAQNIAYTPPSNFDKNTNATQPAIQTHIETNYNNPAPQKQNNPPLAQKNKNNVPPQYLESEPQKLPKALFGWLLAGVALAAFAYFLFSNFVNPKTTVVLNGKDVIWTPLNNSQNADVELQLKNVLQSYYDALQNKNYSQAISYFDPTDIDQFETYTKPSHATVQQLLQAHDQQYTSTLNLITWDSTQFAKLENGMYMVDFLLQQSIKPKGASIHKTFFVKNVLITTPDFKIKSLYQTHKTEL